MQDQEVTLSDLYKILFTKANDLSVFQIFPTGIAPGFFIWMMRVNLEEGMCAGGVKCFRVTLWERSLHFVRQDVSSAPFVYVFSSTGVEVTTQTATSIETVEQRSWDAALRDIYEKLQNGMDLLREEVLKKKQSPTVDLLRLADRLSEPRS